MANHELLVSKNKERLLNKERNAKLGKKILESSKLSFISVNVRKPFKPQRTIYYHLLPIILSHGVLFYAPDTSSLIAPIQDVLSQDGAVCADHLIDSDVPPS